MDKFLEKYNFPKLEEDEAENLHIPITAGEIEAVIKKLPTHKSLGQDGFIGEFYQEFEGQLTPILQRLPKIFKKIEDSQTLFTKPASP